MRPRVPDNFEVEYEYGTRLSKRPPKGEEECVETMYVLASLYSDPNDPVLVATGRAIQNPRDAFSPRIGRDVALGRALKQLERDEVARTRGRAVLDRAGGVGL